ncbi:hypothetical protein WDU94_008482 [Cyamophila willieti]
MIGNLSHAFHASNAVNSPVSAHSNNSETDQLNADSKLVHFEQPLPDLNSTLDSYQSFPSISMANKTNNASKDDNADVQNHEDYKGQMMLSDPSDKTEVKNGTTAETGGRGAGGGGGGGGGEAEEEEEKRGGR